MANLTIAGPVRRYLAEASLGGHRVVRVSSSGKVSYATSATVGHANSIVGITTGAVAEDAEALIQILGPMSEPSWTWTPGLPVFCGLNGNLTQTAPTSGFIKQVGVAETSTKLMIYLQPSIVLT